MITIIVLINNLYSVEIFYFYVFSRIAYTHLPHYMSELIYNLYTIYIYYIYMLYICYIYMYILYVSIFKVIKRKEIKNFWLELSTMSFSIAILYIETENDIYICIYIYINITLSIYIHYIVLFSFEQRHSDAI